MRMEKANASNYYHYNAKLSEKAKRLRNDMTKAEACMWKYVLKAGKINGYKAGRGQS